MRFLHTADWQLGKPFGRFEPEVRAALGEARFDAIDRIGEVAAANQVEHVIVAGDVFDTEGPEDRVIVQAVSRMQRYPCRWRSEEQTSELQSLMRISYAVFCLKKTTTSNRNNKHNI